MSISVTGGVRPEKIIAIEQRLYQQLLVAKMKSGTMQDEIDMELEADANKLDIEREAIQARLARQNQARAVFKAVSTQLSNRVNNAIEHHLAVPESVLAACGISAQQMLLLEMLQSQNLDLIRLRPVIAELDWLIRDLSNVLNSPSFRHQRQQRADVQVTDLKLVLNYIGIENLRILVPYFCLRHWLPSGNTHLLWTIRKLWRYSLATGIAAQALAKLHDGDEGLMYTCALLNQLGTSVVLSCSAGLYEKHWGEWLREAHKSKDKELYDAVMATPFPARALLEQVQSQGQRLNWLLPSLLNFSDSRLTLMLKELDESPSYAGLSADAALIARASCYAKVLMLEEMRQITPQEKRLMFDYYQLSEQEVLRLKGQNYRRVELL
ncbi:HDOD domain-containing protein [Shewanella sp. AS16]|uniref:HDOD domain-containing protein n=1 Tax=Shewanella sp. AS16 TaxID=2907625 RepID=UPI001F427725|nr:HDOD domain-containing protein [Shewanella sp. AS16]MCE9687014.1 HDOD domain-containing protein [Shewanella sp. AS16]